MSEHDDETPRYRVTCGPYEDNIGDLLAENPDDPMRVLLRLDRFGAEVTIEVRRDELEPWDDGTAGDRAPRQPTPEPPFEQGMGIDASR